MLAFQCLPAQGQDTVDAIKVRLLGQPLYLRGNWVDNHLKFDAAGVPEKQYGSGTFTEAGIDVHEVKLSSSGLRIGGQRMGLVFPNKTPKRVPIHSDSYDGWVRIEIQVPPDGDFDKALTAIFAPDLTSLVPSMPFYWQDYAQKNFLATAAADMTDPKTKQGPEAIPGATASIEKPFHVGGNVTRPIVVHTEEPEYSPAARVLKSSGDVEIYLWVLPDGSPSRLRIAKAAGMGMDEQALLALSHYKFKPATKDGKPITVDLYVDVNFQIW